MLNEIDLSRTDLNLLVLFEMVLKQRHVGRAAEKLNLSPSAVSHGLGRLRRLLSDPLFLRTPKGVVPTARALELAEPIADVLARVRSVIATAEPFDPATSRRRFTLGAADGTSAVFLAPLLGVLREAAPGIDISLRQILPPQGSRPNMRAWEPALIDLEAREMDIAVVPSDDIPARFFSAVLYEEPFVIAMRRGHAFAKQPTLEHYCRMEHLLVSMGGDPFGFVDAVLQEHGVSRRVAVTVPNFMMALAVIADTDLLAALPQRFVAMHGPRFGLVSRKVPFPLPRFRIRAVSPKAAMMDAGVAWLFETLQTSIAAETALPGEV